MSLNQPLGVAPTPLPLGEVSQRASRFTTKVRTRIRLGNGSSTSFWMDNWTGEGALWLRIEGPLNRNENKLKVRECWTNHVWHFNKISFVLPLLVSIQKHTFQWINPLADRTIWNLTSSGEYFSSKSAHSLLDSSDSPTINWRWIWRLPCTYRIQHFVWLAVQERLSTRNNLSIRHISNTPYCEWCPSTPERLKPLVTLFAIAFVPQPFGLLFLFPYLDLVITHMSGFIVIQKTNTDPTGTPWQIIFLFAIWHIWNDRNQHLFEPNSNSSRLTPTIIASPIRNTALEWFLLVPA